MTIPRNDDNQSYFRGIHRDDDPTGNQTPPPAQRQTIPPPAGTTPPPTNTPPPKTSKEPPKDDFTRLADFLRDMIANQQIPLPVSNTDPVVIPTQQSTSSMMPTLLIIGGVGALGYLYYKKKGHHAATDHS